MLYCEFRQQLMTYITNTATRHLVLALSGGMDSCVLLHLLARFKQEAHQLDADFEKLSYCAVHIHHGLSENADDWLAQCQRLSQEQGFEFFSHKVTLELGARISVEQAAREARYQALAQHVASDAMLLTGQHGSDQIETFLLALKRGSGPRGLASMAKISPFASGVLFRPLLSCSQSDIAGYATQHQLDWVMDESNQDQRFDRNFIRHSITPLLRQRWPQIEKTVSRSANLCADQEALLSELLEERYRALLVRDGGLSIDGLKGHSERVRAALIRHWLGEQQRLMPSAKQLEHIWQDVALAKVDAAPMFTYGSTQIGRSDNKLYAFARHQDISHVELECQVDQWIRLPDNLGRLVIKSAEANVHCQSVENEMVLSLNLPSQARLKLIFNPAGLTAQPEGRQHSRKLKKLLQDLKVPIWQRQRTPILLCNYELAAMAGLFVCKSFTGQQYQLIWDRFA